MIAGNPQRLAEGLAQGRSLRIIGNNPWADRISEPIIIAGRKGNFYEQQQARADRALRGTKSGQEGGSDQKIL
jgi:hypothetical protein